VGSQGSTGPQGEKGDKGDAGIGGDGLQSISVSGPARAVYTVGQSLDLAGLSVTGVYDDASTVSVTSGYTVIWNSAAIDTGNVAVTAAAGPQTLTVAWRGQTANFIISVNAPGAPIDVYSEANWASALSTISGGGDGTPGAWKDYIINVSENFAVHYGSPLNSFGSVQYVHVTLKGTGTVSLSSQGNLLRLGNNQTLVIDDANLTLQGLKSGQNGATVDNNTALVYLGHANSKLELRNGVISGNTSTNISSGGGVGVWSGEFTMSGGTISGNTGGFGGGVRVSDGTFTMSGGEISGNTAGTAEVGGGVCVWSGAFTMSGGTISGNTSGRGGGVGVYNTGAFSKSGVGIIYGYDSEDPTDPLWNKARNGADAWGHAVYFTKDNGYYRDTTLYTGDNITTSTLPPSGTGGNWTKK
jgi:hypothetical protein